MLILGVEIAAGREDLRRGGVSLRLRQNQLRHDDSARGLRRLEGVDRRRRHRLDQAGRERPAARHQSRGRILRRGARHQREDQSQRHGHAGAQHHLHQRRAHARRRRLVGRHDRRAAGRMPRLARQALDAGDRQSRPAPRPRIPTAASPRPHRSAPDRSGTGRIPRACRSARSSSAAAAPPPCRWSTRPSTGARASTSAPPWARRPRRPPPAPSARCAAIPWPCCPSAAITWATTSGTGSRCSASLTLNAAHLPRELVPQGRGRQVPVAGLQRKHARAQVDRGPRARPRPGQGDAHRLDALLRGHRLERASTSRASSSTSCRKWTATAWRKEVIGHEELFIDLHDHLPPEMIYERELLICRM